MNGTHVCHVDHYPRVLVINVWILCGNDKMGSQFAWANWRESTEISSRAPGHNAIRRNFYWIDSFLERSVTHKSSRSISLSDWSWSRRAADNKRYTVYYALGRGTFLIKSSVNQREQLMEQFWVDTRYTVWNTRPDGLLLALKTIVYLFGISNDILWQSAHLGSLNPILWEFRAIAIIQSVKVSDICLQRKWVRAIRNASLTSEKEAAKW